MSERERYRPFTGDVERKRQLLDPPLALVLCQVRWPELTQLQAGVDSAAIEVGKRLGDFPLHSKNHEVAVTMTPDGLARTAGEIVHQWHSVDNAWHVALSQRSVAVFCTSAYPGFESFASRLADVLDAVHSVIASQVVERVGLRYVNRITDQAVLPNLPAALGSEVLGFARLDAASNDVTRLMSLNQAVYLVGDNRLQVRSGILPAGEVVDPAIEPVSDPSWVLDLDSASERRGVFEASAIVATVGRLADINYDFFKMVATDQYIELVGGQQ